MAVKTITKKNFEQEVLACKKPMLLLFLTETCEESQKQLKLFEELSEELKDSAVFGKVDVNDSVNLAFEYRIMDTPTLIAMSYGIFRGRKSGFQTREELLALLKKCEDGTVTFS